MHLDDFLEFQQIMENLAVTFDSSLDAEKTNSYFDALRDYSVEEVRIGCEECKKTEEWFPKISAIIAAISKSRQAYKPRYNAPCEHCHGTGFMPSYFKIDRKLCVQDLLPKTEMAVKRKILIPTTAEEYESSNGGVYRYVSKCVCVPAAIKNYAS